MNRLILLLLHLLSMVLLFFGWIKDMLHIDINAHFIMDLNIFSEDRSVLGTLQKLWQSNNYWPFLLIFLFGIVVPVVKSVVVFYLLLVKEASNKWFHFLNAISKWAMADVFAVSILVAFLGAGAMQNTNAELEAGFYFFSSYVLLSGVIVMLLGKMIKKAEPSNA